MFKVESREGELESIVLHDSAHGSRVVLAPSRGGMATRFFAHGREAFYLDEATFLDLAKNVRGGNPVLFPQPGKLEGDAYALDGTSFAMKQHGFARNASWEVSGTGTDGAASATLTLRSSPETHVQFPFDFHAEYTYSLDGAVLEISQRFTNDGPKVMPFGAGFHPYFAIAQADKAAATIVTGATRAFDNVSKTEGPLGPIALGAGEVDLHFVDHGPVPCALRWEHGEIEVRGSSEFSRWVIWTLPGKDFVCVEPWTCAGNALNTKQGLLFLQPGETRELSVAIEVRR